MRFYLLRSVRIGRFEEEVTLLPRASALGCALLVAFAGALSLGAPAQAESEGAILYADSPTAVPGRYIVVLNDAGVSEASAVSARAQDLAGRFGGQTRHVYTAGMRGFSVAMAAKQAQRMAADPAVAYVQQVQQMSIMDTQNN